MKKKSDILKKYRNEIRNILRGGGTSEELLESKHKVRILAWVLELSKKDTNKIIEEEREKLNYFFG